MEERPKIKPFSIKGMADIKHLNLRKEGPEEEKIMAVDIKLVFSKIDRTLCEYFDEALVPFLWIPTTESFIVRNMYLKPVGYMNTIRNAEVIIAGRRFVGAEAKKFEIEPRDGGVIDLTCSVSIYPDSEDVSHIADLVQEGCHVSIESQPGLFDEPANSESKKSEPVQDDMADSEDPLLGQAYQIILKENKASISLVQRHLRIGYNRAARLLEELETRNLVSPMQSNGQRDVL